jgi:hypothetical protein
MISQPLCEVDCSECAFSNFALSFEELVEVALIYLFLQLQGPFFDDGRMGGLKT